MSSIAATVGTLQMLRGAMEVHRASADADGEAYFLAVGEALAHAVALVEGHADLERRLADALELLALSRCDMRRRNAIIAEAGQVFNGPADAFPGVPAAWVRKVQIEAIRVS